MHEMLTYSIARTDLDLRRTLYSRIVLSGGSTLFPGTYPSLSLYLHKLLQSNSFPLQVLATDS